MGGTAAVFKDVGGQQFYPVTDTVKANVSTDNLDSQNPGTLPKKTPVFPETRENIVKSKNAIKLHNLDSKTEKTPKKTNKKRVATHVLRLLLPEEVGDICQGRFALTESLDRQTVWH